MEDVGHKKKKEKKKNITLVHAAFANDCMFKIFSGAVTCLKVRKNDKEVSMIY